MFQLHFFRYSFSQICLIEFIDEEGANRRILSGFGCISVFEKTILSRVFSDQRSPLREPFRSIPFLHSAFHVDTHGITEGSKEWTEGEMAKGNKKKSVHRPNRSRSGPFTDRSAANISLETDPRAKYKITKRTHFLVFTIGYTSMTCDKSVKFLDKKRTHFKPFFNPRIFVK